MFTTIGVLILLIAVLMMLIKWFIPLRTEDEQVPNRYNGTDTKKAHPKILTNWKGKTSIVLIVIAVICMLIPHSYMYARQGHQYYVVNPFGGVSCYYDAGVKIIIPGSRIQEWEKFVDVKTVATNEPSEGIEGIISESTNYTAKDLETNKPIVHTLWGIGARFNDQVRGNIRVSVRVQLPADDKDFIALVEDFRHPKNLINNTLIPTVREQTINVGYMFSAEDYVSGEASNFRQTLDDALKYGGYAVERHEKPDTIYKDVEVDGEREVREIRSIITVKKKLDSDGAEIRTEHDITKNKLIVSQVIVDKVNLEPKFQQKLEKQRDISAQKSIEIQLTETAQMEQQRIIAQGERDKASKRVEEEKKQVGTLIAIETDKKREVTNKELAAIKLETAKLDAAKMKVEADAKRYEINNADGLSAEVKFIQEEQTKRTLALATAIEKANWPTTLVEGGGGNNSGSGLLQTLIGAELATQMMQKNTK